MGSAIVVMAAFPGGRRVMSRALEPKQLRLIEADEHGLSGKEQDLNQKLMDASSWIKTQRR